jgi:hypothetical protein
MKKIILILLLIPILCFAGTLQEKQKMVIAKRNSCSTAQTITWNTQPAAMAYGDADQDLTQATSDSSLTIAYTTDTTTYCTVVAGPKLHAVNASGNCVVHANQAGNGTYCAATQVNSGNIAITGDPKTCNGSTYTNDETCTFFDYATVSPGGYTVSDLTWVDNAFTAVKATAGGTASLKDWYDPNFAYKTVDGVTTLLSIDSNHHTIAPPASTNSPAVTANCINTSKKCLTFDGSNDYLAFATLPTYLNGASSIFTVLHGYSGMDAYAYAFTYAKASGDYPLAYIELADSNYGGGYYKSSSIYSSISSSTAANNTTFYTFEGQYAATTCTSGSWRINGGTLLSETHLGTRACLTGQDYAWIGSGVFASTTYIWKGSIATFAGFGEALSSGDMTTIRAAIQTQYGHY